MTRRRPSSKLIQCGIGCGWLLFLFLGGCSSSGPVETFAVTGTVTRHDGQPLPGGQILFRPLGASPHSARGDVEPDGTFTLTTFSPGDGAIAGNHKVIITPDVPQELQEDVRALMQQQPQVDAKYQTLRNSPLEYTVAGDGSENHFDIVLDPPSQRR